MQRMRTCRARARGFAWAASACVASALATVGCAGNARVTRVVDGHVTEGRFIGEGGYEAFLRGALAEEQGDLGGALLAYRATAAADPGDPEVARRLARVEHRLAQPHPSAEATLADEPAEGRPAPPAERARLEGLTLLHRDRPAAWEALAAWGSAHGDIPLMTRGMLGLARETPGRRARLAEAALALLGRGYASEAGALAGAILDGDARSGDSGVPTASMKRLVRLALDEALLRHDASLVDDRSTVAHVGSEVAAGRAWLVGDVRLARSLVSATAKADPSNLAARLLLEGLAGRASARVLGGSDAAAVPFDVCLPFARDVLLAEGASAARRVLALAPPPLPSGDPLLTPLLVELTIAGAVAEETLPSDARIELAARRRILPADKDVSSGAVDERHVVLGLALLRPTDPATRARALGVAGAAGQDPLVAVALARIALARGEVVPSALRARLDALAPSDPIAAATLLDLVQHGGPPSALDHAKRQLAGLAQTPGEHALLAE